MWCSFRFEDYHFEVKYKKGKDNQQADALSRLRTNRQIIRHDDDGDIIAFSIDEKANADEEEFQHVDFSNAGKRQINSLYKNFERLCNRGGIEDEWPHVQPNWYWFLGFRSI